MLEDKDMNNYLLKNPGIRISNKIKPIINSLGLEFKKKYHKLITITSGTRSAKEQAGAMYSNFKKEKGTATQRKKYRNKKLFDEIATAYNKYKDKTSMLCISAMEKVIKSQIQKKKYISLHLIDSAVDIRTRTLSTEEIDFLIGLIKARNFELKYQDKRNNKNPHIHLQLK